MVNINGNWGSVCDDSFSQREADVACRSMQYDGALSFQNVQQSTGYHGKNHFFPQIYKMEKRRRIDLMKKVILVRKNPFGLLYWLDKRLSRFLHPGKIYPVKNNYKKLLKSENFFFEYFLLFQFTRASPTSIGQQQEKTYHVEKLVSITDISYFIGKADFKPKN